MRKVNRLMSIGGGRESFRGEREKKRNKKNKRFPVKKRKEEYGNTSRAMQILRKGGAIPYKMKNVVGQTAQPDLRAN